MSPKSAIERLQEVFCQHGVKEALKFLLTLPEETRRTLSEAVGMNPDEIEKEIRELEGESHGME